MNDAHEITKKPEVAAAAHALNEAIARAAMSGHTIKLSVRTFPGVGAVARCPQVKVEIEAKEAST